jgi:hypothetical protein
VARRETVPANWKEFQDLVARIERLAAPLGAKVKSPDRIRDKVTGQLRDVDASIRYRVGTTEILIAIEARHRNGVQDVTWIEQLAGRRDSIGAHATIAVSSTSFSEPARKLAEARGIALRNVRETTDDEITRWFVPVQRIKPAVIFVAWEPHFYGCDPTREDVDLLAATVNAAVERDGAKAKVFLFRGKPVSLWDLFMQTHGNRGTRLFDGCDDIGTPQRRLLTIKLDPNLVRVRTIDGMRDVESLRMIVDLTTVAEAVPPTLAVSYDSAGGGTEAVHGVFDIDDATGGGGVRLLFQNHGSKDVPAMTALLRDEKGNFRPAKLEFVRSYKPDTPVGKENRVPPSDIRVVNPDVGPRA